MKAGESSFHPQDTHTGAGHIHFLERQQLHLKSLSTQLNSYHCVPRTASLHQRMERLRRALSDLSKENEDMVSSFRTTRESPREHFDICETQFAKLMELEARVLEYIKDIDQQG